MADYSAPALARAAGVDPWALQQRLATGDPGAIQNAGLGFRRAGAMATEAADAGRVADREAAGSFHNDGTEVIDAAASSARGVALLGGDGERMEETARALLEVAAALTEAAAAAAGRLDRLQADLRHIVERRNAAVVAAAPLVAEGINQQYHRMAVEAVRAAAATVQAEIDDYGAVLANRTTRVLAQAGDQPPASTDGADRALPPGEDGLVSDLADGTEVIANGVGRAAGELVDGVNRAGGAIGGAVGDAASAIVDGVSDGDPLDGLGDAADAVHEGLGEAEDEIEAGVDRAGEQIGDAAGEAVGYNPDAGGEADRNGVWEQTTGPTPPPDQIEVTRQSHVVFGDGDGGGHIHDSGVPNKTTFPPGWDDDRIVREVRDVARNPDPGSEPVFDEDRGAWRVEGVRDGVRIRSYVTEQGDVTGHPLGGPGVHRNDENGDPQPVQ